MSAISLNFGLHEAQQEIYNHPSRFKVVAAGRRFGKTYLAVILCIVNALKTHNDYGDELDDTSEVIYVGVTLEQARRNAWNLFKKLADPVIAVDKNGRKMIHENTSLITLVNGVRIRLLGMDNPDAARGMKLRYAVLDEYADMPAGAFPEIIRPALIDCRGGALFIGTPKGRNHFFEAFRLALSGENSLWGGFNFSSTRNSFLSADELLDATEELTRGSDFLYRQEIEANFLEPGGDILRPENFVRSDKDPAPGQGEWKIAVDLAGFVTDAKQIKQRDSHAIAIVKVFPVEINDGRSMATAWWIKEIKWGQWDVRTTAYHIAQAIADYPGAEVGIEKGALKNAVEPYLRDYLQEYGLRMNITELRHNNQSKHDRIRWALEGRSQKGRIYYAYDGQWTSEFMDQAGNFPSKNVHDDLIDAVAYIDQMCEVAHFDMDYVNSIGGELIDVYAGY